MKICTLYKFSNEYDPPDVSFSVVDDNHQFGWDETHTQLHVEGKLEVKEIAEPKAPDND